ncbi:hypothetical protein [Streptomyces sp. XH2]|uniref:hypothetical protein n=1 Tax=Streptomyces sp. XH2 TaxID=3412483 RepID=UPI003C7BF4D2
MTRRLATVGVIGAGNVGHTVATLLTATDWCARLFISARYRVILARAFGVPVAAVEGQVIGEHGDGAVLHPVRRLTATPPSAGRAVRAEHSPRPNRQLRDARPAISLTPRHGTELRGRPQRLMHRTPRGMQGRRAHGDGGDSVTVRFCWGDPPQPGCRRWPWG